MADRSYMLDELGDPDAPVGSRLWALYVSNEIRRTLYDKEKNGDRLKNLVSMFKTNQGFQELGHLSWEEFCEKRLQKQADDIEIEITSREEIAKARANNPKQLNNTPGQPKKNPYNYKDSSPETHGTSADYFTARIARDHPDILERMQAGEFKSTRAAAIEAGIVDPSKTPFQVNKDPTKAGRYLAQRVDREWMEAMIDAYYQNID